MTLIVARTFGETVWIVGDTKFSGGPTELPQPQLGLKILALDQNTFIGYSGSPEIAHEILGNLAAKCGGKSLNETADVLMTELTKRRHPEIDFIIAHHGQISTVKNHKHITNQQVAWIGDSQAFEAFQKYCKLIESDKLQIGNILEEAMQLVIGDLSIQSVGGQVTVAISEENDSHYLSFGKAVSPRYKPIAEEWKAVDFGNAANGGYSFTTITPAEKGISGWGYFLHQARFGRYFAADLSRQSFVIFVSREKNAAEFCSVVSKELGYEITHAWSWGS